MYRTHIYDICINTQKSFCHPALMLLATVRYKFVCILCIITIYIRHTRICIIFCMHNRNPSRLAEYRLFYRALLQKRPTILRSLLIVATQYQESLKINVVSQKHTHTHTHTHTYIYMYMKPQRKPKIKAYDDVAQKPRRVANPKWVEAKHTHTHTHSCVYTYT